MEPAKQPAKRFAKQLKIAIVCSSGGHLYQLFVLKDWWKNFDRFWVTFKKPDAESMLAGERVHYSYFPTNRNIPNLIRNTFLALRILFKERPDVIVSSGAGVALPFFFLGKLLRKKLIFLEVFDRLDHPTLTGRLVYPICDKFLVQWDEQRAFYPRAELWGQAL
jgi:UDP-N-acetylglucosamine:LPS N-acetylglucosamine transferase